VSYALALSLSATDSPAFNIVVAHRAPPVVKGNSSGRITNRTIHFTLSQALLSQLFVVIQSSFGFLSECVTLLVLFKRSSK